MLHGNPLFEIFMYKRKPLIDADWLLGPPETTAATHGPSGNSWTLIAVLIIVASGTVYLFSERYVAGLYSIQETANDLIATSRPLESKSLVASTVSLESVAVAPATVPTQTAQATISFKATARPVASRSIRSNISAPSSQFAPLPELESLISLPPPNSMPLTTQTISTSLPAPRLPLAQLQPPIVAIAATNKLQSDAPERASKTGLATRLPIAVRPALRVQESANYQPSIRTIAYTATPEVHEPAIVPQALQQSSQPLSDTSVDSETNAHLNCENTLTSELIRSLSDVRPQVAGAVMHELQRRGMTEEQLTIAIELTGGDIQARLSAVDRLMQTPNISPLPWLVWMSTDREVQIRQRAIEALASVPGEAARLELRMLLNREPDSGLQDLIRRLSMTASNVRIIR